MKRKYGHITYNKYCNFTNYGSALHTFALQRVLNSIAPGEIESVVIDYCPQKLEGVDVLNPFERLWDSNEEIRHMILKSMPNIEINKSKFDSFYDKNINFSRRRYTSDNINDSAKDEGLYGYVCGSDTIWCLSEFGEFDIGYFGDCNTMKELHTVSYAASFGDDIYSDIELKTLIEKMANFKAISVRENTNLEYIKNQLNNKIVERTLDPTLLLSRNVYDEIESHDYYDKPYVLLYARRYDKKMEEYADKIAEDLGCEVIEISLRAINSNKHTMRYDAGVEEFLSLIKNAKYVVTNSFHGVIFSIIYHIQFDVFTREQADVKIRELVNLLSISNNRINPHDINVNEEICYEQVEDRILIEREKSMSYLRKALEIFV